MDSEAQFEAMYQRHGAAVRAFVHRRLARELADDVTADVFVAAWRRRGEAPEDELSWLLGIARGVLANSRRVESRRVALHERLRATAVPDRSSGPEERTLRSADITEAFLALREADREVLRLVAWDGLDRAQAARVLGISASVFSVRLHRARRRLEQELARREEEHARPAGSAPVEVSG